MVTEYAMAEWLLYNVRMRLAYTKAGSLERKEAIEYIIDHLKYTIQEYHKGLTLYDIDALIADERVRIIVDKYYLKEWNYEH
jgi:hypothetical protein